MHLGFFSCEKSLEIYWGALDICVVCDIYATNSFFFQSFEKVKEGILGDLVPGHLYTIIAFSPKDFVGCYVSTNRRQTIH